jgi:hypothetical protein
MEIDKADMREVLRETFHETDGYEDGNNAADALFRIAKALERIAEALEDRR